jgi:hypothetical protein
MKYRIGLLSWLKDEDPYFDTQDEAEDEAVQESLDESAYGVWEIDEETGHAELLCIAYQSTLFYP